MNAKIPYWSLHATIFVPKELGPHLNDPDKIREFMGCMARELNILGLEDIDHKFQPCGVTVIQILAESGHEVHAWPEYIFLKYDLNCCRYIENLSTVLDILRRVMTGVFPGSWIGKPTTILDLTVELPQVNEEPTP